MAYLGRKGAVAPLTSADIPVGIVEGTDIAFFENASGTQNLGGTYSTERMYLNDSYTLTGDVTITGHLALATIADSDVIITNDSSARTITGSGTLETGELMNERQTSLTGMTGELGSAVTGSPAITGVGTLTTGSIGSGVTGFTGIKAAEIWTYEGSDFAGSVDPVIDMERISEPAGYGGVIYGSGITVDATKSMFSFPSTGHWWIHVSWTFYRTSGSDRACGVKLNTTVNNSSYVTATFGSSNLNHDSTGNRYANVTCNHIFDVTDITTHKCRLSIDTPSATTYTQNTASQNRCCITFFRLGDT